MAVPCGKECLRRSLPRGIPHLCLLILPISVLLLQGGGHGTAGGPIAETTGVTGTVVTEDIAANIDGVVFRHGDCLALYDGLAACLDAELPEIYYPTVFPEGVKPISVTVTESEDAGAGLFTDIGFNDDRYSISISVCNEQWSSCIDNGYREVDLLELLGDAAFSTFEAYQKIEEDAYSLYVNMAQRVYEFYAADAESVCSMLKSMRRADYDHVHGTHSKVFPIIKENGDVMFQVEVSCSVCDMREEQETAEQAEQGE